jgi:hypothetical protein
MSDEVVTQRPLAIDTETPRSFGSSTWTTRAGSVHVLGELPVAGERRTYDELIDPAVPRRVHGVVTRCDNRFTPNPQAENVAWPRFLVAWRRRSQGPPDVDSVRDAPYAVGRYRTEASHPLDGGPVGSTTFASRASRHCRPRGSSRADKGLSNPDQAPRPSNGLNAGPSEVEKPPGSGAFGHADPTFTRCRR